ncbi:MAG: CpXC domain-containing protein [Bacillota bacterium]|nr:CpXC domain-containing protein [Bacillota bacterium]
MSNTVMKTISCPRCNARCEKKLFLSVNVNAEPTLRADVLNEKLFKWRCASCGYEARITYPILYNDIKGKFMVYLIPDVDRFQLADPDLEKEYGHLLGVVKRSAPTLNVFKEKIFIFEAGLDDMAVELTKLAISETVSKKLRVPAAEGYLSMFSRESNTMGFTFFLGPNNEPYIQSTRLEIYVKSLGIVSSVAGKDKKLSGFLNVDREWAENALFRYKKLQK